MRPLHKLQKSTPQSLFLHVRLEICVQKRKDIVCYIRYLSHNFSMKKRYHRPSWQIPKKCYLIAFHDSIS